jgi:hypothetical protein
VYRGLFDYVRVTSMIDISYPPIQNFLIGTSLKYNVRPMSRVKVKPSALIFFH